MPGVTVEVLKRGRAALEAAINREEYAWDVNGAGLPLPVGEMGPMASDLTTLWALEALAPVSTASKSRRLPDARPALFRIAKLTLVAWPTDN